MSCSTNPKNSPPCIEGYYMAKNKKNEDCCYKITQKMMNEGIKKQKQEAKEKKKLEKETVEKAKKEKKTEKEAKEKAAKEKAEKEAKEEAKEKAAKEAKEKEAKEKAEKEAKEKAEKEAKEKAAKEKAEKEAKEKEAKEKEAKEKAAKEKSIKGKKAKSPSPDIILDNIPEKVKKFLKLKLQQHRQEKIKNKDNYFKELEKNKDYLKYCNLNSNKNDKALSTIVTEFVAKFKIQYLNTPFKSSNVMSTNKFIKKNSNTYSYSNLIPLYYNTFNTHLLEKFYDINLTQDQYSLSNSIINGEWLQETNNYINSLSVLDSLTVHGYTWHGDVIVNNYCRNVFTHQHLLTYIDDHKLSSRYFPLYMEFVMYIKNTNNFSNIFNNQVANVKYNSQPSTYYNPVELDIIRRVFSKISFSQYVKQNDNANKNPYIDLMKIINSNLKLHKDNNHFDLYYKIYYPMIKHVFKHVKWETWLDIIGNYKKRLNDIINKSPPLKQNMTVLRGIKDDYIFTNLTTNSIFKNNSFISSSFDYDVAKKFNADQKCCIIKIKLLKGAKALLLNGLSVFPPENEFLLSSDTKFIVNYKKEEGYIPNITSVCIDKNSQNYKKIMMADMVAI